MVHATETCVIYITKQKQTKTHKHIYIENIFHNNTSERAN